MSNLTVFTTRLPEALIKRLKRKAISDGDKLESVVAKVIDAGLRKEAANAEPQAR